MLRPIIQILNNIYPERTLQICDSVNALGSNDLNIKVKVNFEINIADRKASTCI